MRFKIDMNASTDTTNPSQLASMLLSPTKYRLEFAAVLATLENVDKNMLINNDLGICSQTFVAP